MPDPTPARILVADDEATILELLQTVLSLWSFEVEVCADGQAALARALEGTFSLLLFDHQMPGMTGLEALRRLRGGKCVTPAVLMSGYLTDEVTRQGLDLPHVGLLSKPFALESLRAALDRALGR